MREKKTRTGEQFFRIEQVIQSDKSVMSEGCKSLVLQDFARTFEEYFELSSFPEMQIECKNGVYDVQIRFSADRVKKFNVLK